MAFPEALWLAAGQLAQRRGVYLTARALGLEYSKVKRASGQGIARVRGEAKRPPTAKPIKFIEFTDALAASASGCRLSLRNVDGQRLQMAMVPSAATAMVLQLCGSGWTASL